MRWFGAFVIATGAFQTWKAVQAGLESGFHPWVTVLEQNKGRGYSVPLFEALTAGVVWLLAGVVVFLWGLHQERLQIRDKPTSKDRRTEPSPGGTNRRRRRGRDRKHSKSL